MNVSEILEGVKNGNVSIQDAETQLKPKNGVKPGTTTYELLVAKYVKKEGRGWHTIEAVIGDETDSLDEIIDKLKVTPSKLKTLMTEAEKEYNNRLAKRSNNKNEDNN